LSLLERHELTPAQIDVVAEWVARFHGEHRLAATFGDAEWRQRICGPVHDNFCALAAFPEPIVPRATLARLERRNAEFERARLPRLLSRVNSGQAVDGHGDLHLQHVWFEPGRAEPLIIDCLEFDEELRQFDTACDVAFLAMDLRYRGRESWAERLLRRYARDADDFGLYAVVDYYAAYRAAVRAKVAAIAAQDERVSPSQREAAGASARRHVALADRLLEARAPGALVAVCGIVGAGKTTVADLVADELRGAVVCADRVRKRMAGLDPLASARAEPERGLYTPEQRAHTYSALLERAADVVGSGRVAVLDATFSETAQRDHCRAWAEKQGVAALLIEVECDEAVAMRRVAKRRERGGDASDAGPELYARSARLFEKPREWPRTRRLRVDTSRPGWRRAARAAVRRLVADAGSRP
jgi:predicted kinase